MRSTYRVWLLGGALLCGVGLTACGAQAKTTPSLLAIHQASVRTAAPTAGKRVFVDILRATKVAGGYHVMAVPTHRNADDSWSDDSGHAPQPYFIATSVVGTAVQSLIGTAALTLHGGKVVGLEIVGG